MLSSRTVPAYLASLTVLAVLTGVLLAPSAQAGGKKDNATKAAPAAAPAPATTATGAPRSAYRFTVKDFPVARPLFILDGPAIRPVSTARSAIC